MGGIPLSKAAAAVDLQRLQSERGMVQNDPQASNSVLVSSLNEALNILSDQLYQTPTHFILELIQNADDNSYAANVTPTLHLSLYRKGNCRFFRADCNEVGFTFEQLDALTRVGQSTKRSAADRRKGYIGEKGIGFKAVFKVADVVQVASGYYEFKLDRRKSIGMILPIPTPFPVADRVAGHTQFLLRLKNSEDNDAIHRDLKHVEPQLLLFLRRLRELHVSNKGTSNIYRLETAQSGDDYGGEIGLISKSGGDDEVAEISKYVIHRHTVQNLPRESRREGISKSEVVVAFAVKDRDTPITETQKIFAFLPVDDYGFRFLIHADFLLVASRESLEYDCAWNSALQSGILAALMEAFDRFVALSEVEHGEGLRYTWLKYLARQPGSSTSWNDLHERMIKDLADKKVLWSRDKDTPLQEPRSLYFVPQSYRFEGRDLFDIPSIKSTHLSFAYDGVKEEAHVLGVRELDLPGLYREFDSWISNVGVAGIRKQSSEWHTKINSLFCDRSGLKQKLKKLPIIPLRDGRWVSAQEKHLYLPSRNRDEHVPTGVEISIVDYHASRDPVRQRFFAFLGIEEYSPRQVCSLILDFHTNFLPDPRIHRSDEELVADAVYIFKHRSAMDTNGAPSMFFLALRDGVSFRRRKEQIYLIDSTVEPDLIAKFRDTPGNPFAILSDKYELAITEKLGTERTKEFREWLLRSSSLNFASEPILIRDKKPTSEWYFLVEQNVADLLSVVKSVYSTKSKSMSPPEVLTQVVQALEVPCRDGVSRPLCELAVPTPELLQKCPHLNFADLPSPTLQNWNFLSKFGVITVCDVTARLRELQALKKLRPESIDKKSIREIYQALNSKAIPEGGKIRKAFLTDALVFVDKPSPRWLNHQSCVWKASRSLRRVTSLASHYPDCRELFCSCLRVESASISHAVDELCSISYEEKQIEQRFGELISLLGRHHSSTDERLTSKQIERIQGAQIFPIQTTRRGPQENPTIAIAMRPITGALWYIPDNTILENAFRDKVEMLRIPVQAARSLRNLFTDLSCEGRFLSSAVQEKVMPQGKPTRDGPFEADLNTRLKYVSRLGANNFLTSPNFPPLQAWSVPLITMSMSLGDIKVAVDDELITIRERDGKIDIYLRENMQELDRSTVNFVLMEYFQKKFKIDEKKTNLANHLMSASLTLLPKILERNNISPPEDASDDGTSEKGQALPDKEVAAPSRTDKVPDSNTKHGNTELGDNTSTDGHEHDDKELIVMSTTRKRGRSRSPERETLPSSPPPPRRKVIIVLDSDSDEPAEKGFPSKLKPTAKTPQTPHHQKETRPPSSLLTSPSPLRPPRELLFPSPQAKPETIHQSASNLPTADARRGMGEAFRPLARVQAESGPDVGGSGESRSVRGLRGASASVSALVTPPRNRRSRLHVQPFEPISPGAGVGARDGGREREEDEVRKKIGFLGEVHVYKMFSRQIVDWTSDNWTSEMRSKHGHPPFAERQKDFADFTYRDRAGHMRTALRESGVELNPQWSDDTVFHLEVKATPGQCAEAFYVSQNQVDMMRRFGGDPNNAYIILRVFQVGVEEHNNNTGVKFLRDPWSLYMDGTLDVRSETGVYKVYY